MATKRKSIVVAILLVAVLTAGCFEPGEEQATEPGEETGTTPGETVEGGAQPTEVPESPTVFDTATDLEGTTGEPAAGEADETTNGTAEGTESE